MTTTIDGTLGVTTPAVILTNTGTSTLLGPLTAGSFTQRLPAGNGTLLLTQVIMNFPTTLGTSTQVMTTDGAGNLYWSNAGMSSLNIGTTTITTGTTGSILVDTLGVLQEITMGAGVAAGLAAAAGSGSGFATLTGGFLPLTQGGVGGPVDPSWTTILGTAAGTGVGAALSQNAGAANGFAVLNGSGVLPISQGGTGASTAAAAANNLLPAQSAPAGKVLSSDGAGNLSWVNNDSGLTIGTTLIVGGTSNTLLYENAGVLDETAVGVTGQVLKATTGAAPSWGSGSITLGTTTIALGGTALTLNGLNEVVVTTDTSNPLGLTTKQYVDAITSPINRLAPVACATTANISLSGLQTIDGYATSAGDRVLVKNQTSSQNDGVYIADPGVWNRATDLDQPSEFIAATCFVLNGGQANTSWIQIYTVTTVGTSLQSWLIQSALAPYSGGPGISVVGYTINNTGVLSFSGGTTGLTPSLASAGNIVLSGTLQPSNGGTGLTSLGTGVQTALSNAVGGSNGLIISGASPLTQHGVVVGGASGVLNSTSAGVTGEVLAAVSGADPVWTSNLTLGVQGTVAGYLRLANTALGAVPTTIQSSPSASAAWTLTLPVDDGLVGQVLTTDGLGNTSWTNAANGTPSGVNTQVQYNNSGAFGASAGFTFDGFGAVTIGVGGASTGTLSLGGSTSGSVLIQSSANASGTLTLPNGNATVLATAASGTAGQVLQSNGAGVNPTWVNSSSVAVVSVGQTFTGGLISVSGSPVTSSGTLALTVAGTSGGIPYFDSASSWASSGVLSANNLVVGGGAGAAPSTVATGAGVLSALSNAAGGANGFALLDGAGVLPTAQGGVGGTVNSAWTTILGTAPGTGVGTALGLSMGAANGFAALNGSGVLPIAQGGTNASTAVAAANNILPAQSGPAGKVLTSDGAGNLSWTSVGGAGVTSVDVSGGTTGLTTSGGPVTGSGTITIAGTLAVASGGTGSATQQAAINTLAGAVTSGQYLRGNGTNVVMSSIQASDVPTLNQNTTGTASNVTGTVAIANGGTGATTAVAAANNLLPSQVGQGGNYLTTNGSGTLSWAAAGGGYTFGAIGTTSVVHNNTSYQFLGSYPGTPTLWGGGWQATGWFNDNGSDCDYIVVRTS